jgi:hypothetical protein
MNGTPHDRPGGPAEDPITRLPVQHLPAAGEAETIDGVTVAALPAGVDPWFIPPAPTDLALEDAAKTFIAAAYRAERPPAEHLPDLACATIGAVLTVFQRAVPPEGREQLFVRMEIVLEGTIGRIHNLIGDFS